MRKRVSLNIDRGSWTSAPVQYRHPVPVVLPSGSSTEVDFLGSLLQLGILTVPWRGAACSLAAYWAYVRYLAATDLLSTYLRLLPEWSEIDSHQKTILSDDWGVGFTTHWLAKRLGYRFFCDGRYFINRLRGLGIATVNRKPKKRGPYKSPDFIFLDALSRFHVLECKGNQQSRAELQSQLADGMVQKQSIIFANEQLHVAQRMAAGLFIADAESDERSELALRDPEPREGLIVRIRSDVDPALLHDQVVRGDLSTQFRVVGAEFLSDALDRLPDQHNINEERQSNLAELIGLFCRSADKRGRISRAATIPFPGPIGNDGFRAVRITHEADVSFVRQFARFVPSRALLGDQFPEADIRNLSWESVENETGAAIRRGDHFVSRIAIES